jgi:hypothetical protein
LNWPFSASRRSGSLLLRFRQQRRRLRRLWQLLLLLPSPLPLPRPLLSQLTPEVLRLLLPDREAARAPTRQAQRLLLLLLLQRMQAPILPVQLPVPVPATASLCRALSCGNAC